MRYLVMARGRDGHNRRMDGYNLPDALAVYYRAVQEDAVFYGPFDTLVYTVVPVG